MEVRLADIVDGIEEERQEDENLKSCELEHRSEHDDEVSADLNHSPHCAIHVFKDVNVTIENLQDLADRCHIKEEIYGCIQDSLESLAANLLTDFMVATVNNVVLDHVEENSADSHQVKCSYEATISFIIYVNCGELMIKTSLVVIDEFE